MNTQRKAAAKRATARVAAERRLVARGGHTTMDELSGLVGTLIEDLTSVGFVGETPERWLTVAVLRRVCRGVPPNTEIVLILGGRSEVVTLMTARLDIVDEDGRGRIVLGTA